MGKECRVWVVFANERKCNHTRCLLTKGFVSQGGRIKMRSPPKVLTGSFHPSQLSSFLS